MTRIVHFELDQDLMLFTTGDYRNLLVKVDDHFLVECTRQGIEVEYARSYYNPQLNRGCIEYEFSNFDGLAYIPEMEFPLADTMYIVTFA